MADEAIFSAAPDATGVVHVPEGEGRRVWFSGDAYTVMLTEVQSNGSLGVIHASVPPGGGPPDHFHAEHDELFCLLDGVLDFSHDGREFQASRGDLVLIKRGSLHRFHNSGLLPVTMLFLYTPGGPEGLFVEGGDEPVPDQQVQPWGPKRIDERLLGLLAKYDERWCAPAGDVLAAAFEGSRAEK